MLSRALGLLALLAGLLAPIPAAAQPLTDAEARELAVEAYIYAFPMVLMEVTRRVMTAVPEPTPGGDAPMNRLGHRPVFPDHNSTFVVRPNADTLYSMLWFDVSREPLILGVPDSAGRYYLLQFMDLWSDTFAAVGTRTTGNGAQRFALVGPDWQGDLPGGIEAIRTPTAYGWMIGRAQTNGTGDYAAVRRFQAGMTAVPLSSFGRPFSPPPIAIPAGVDRSAPVEQVGRMSPEVFFATFTDLLGANPPHTNDQPVLARIRRLGFVPGRPFDFAAAPPAVQAALRVAPAAAIQRIRGGTGGGPAAANGWFLPPAPVGTYGTYYARRAAVAFAGLGANSPEDAVYPGIRRTADGQPLDGAGRYVLHFAPGQLPPARAFWSISLYNDRQFFAENSIGRYAIGDRDDLAFNADGSLDIYVQRESPGPERARNWLPAPASGNFSLAMRIYLPEPQAVDGRWMPPPLRRSEQD